MRIPTPAIAATLLVASLSFAAPHARGQAAKPTVAALVGEWNGGLNFQNTDVPLHVIFAKKDTAVVGLLTLTGPNGGLADSTWGLKTEGEGFTFSGTYQNMYVVFRAKLRADTLDGSYHVMNNGVEAGSGPWWGVKKKSEPAPRSTVDPKRED
jgi:hypothetical protein